MTRANPWTRVILTQICEVEVQEIVFEQFSSYFSLFGSDLSHLSDNQASFDQNAVGLYSQLFGSDGSLNNGDLGFSGSDIGNSSIVPSGNNWDSQTSPASVSAAQNLTQSALNSVSNHRQIYLTILNPHLDCIQLHLFVDLVK